MDNTKIKVKQNELDPTVATIYTTLFGKHTVFATVDCDLFMDEYSVPTDVWVRIKNGEVVELELVPCEQIKTEKCDICQETIGHSPYSVGDDIVCFDCWLEHNKEVVHED